MKPTRTALPKFADRLSLGETGLRVSPFCLGMTGSDETYGAAFDAGINFFFLTADMHWPLYEASRQGLASLLARNKNIRQQIVVAAVSYPTQPEFCYAPFQEVVDAVPGLKEIDVAVIGGAYAGEFEKRLEIYQQLRREGYLGIKGIGTTFHDRQAALRAMNDQAVDLALIRYNPSHFGAGTNLFPHLKQPVSTPLFNFKSTVGFMPPARFTELGLDDHYWQPHITDYYRFALTRPEIDGLLCAPSTPRELAALSRALEHGPLDEEAEAYLLDLAALNEGRAKLLSRAKPPARDELESIRY